MFWDKNDTPSQNIEALLEKEDVTVEELLDEDDIIQECKTKKKPIVSYITRPDVIKRMIELITTEPAEELPMALRFRHANVACEILLLGLPSLDEKLIGDEETLKSLYSYLENEPPLNPLLASFVSKTFSMLFTKKSDQDWFLYQQLCLKLLEFLKNQKNFLDLVCKHFTTPVIPDLIIEMMNNVDGGVLKRSLYDWLNEERLVEKLIHIIGDPEQSEKHANVAEFLCDLIQQGRTMRQEGYKTFEPVFEGSNPILKNIESATTLFALFNEVLQPNAPESAIVAGINVVHKMLSSPPFDGRNTEEVLDWICREKKFRDELISTVIRVFEPQLKYFNELLRNPPKKPDIQTSAAKLSPPFGKTRLQICRLFAVLLRTNNLHVAKAICETDFLDILLSLFKQYCWNNFLHTEVVQCFQGIFDKWVSIPVPEEGLDEFEEFLYGDMVHGDQTAMQKHVIKDCKVVSKLLECWKINQENESAENGRRLGYMGHLIQIFKFLTDFVKKEAKGALIEDSLQDDAERELWQSIVNPTDGELTQALATQGKYLANCVARDYDVSLDFLTDNDFSGAFNTSCAITDSIDMDTFGRTNDDEEDEDEDNATAGEGLFFGTQASPFTVTSNPWDNKDDFGMFKSAPSAVPWALDSTPDNFADFDAHFSSFSNDMGESLPCHGAGSPSNDNIGDVEARKLEGSLTNTLPASTTSEEFDNNANVERFFWNSLDHPPFQLKKDNTATYTKNNFVDYYEDDEGMWTKPLGSSAVANKPEEESESAATEGGGATVTVPSMIISNGPTKTPNEEDSKEPIPTEAADKEANEPANKNTSETISLSSPSSISSADSDKNVADRNAVNSDPEPASKPNSSTTEVIASTDNDVSYKPDAATNDLAEKALTDATTTITTIIDSDATADTTTTTTATSATSATTATTTTLDESNVTSRT